MDMHRNDSYYQYSTPSSLSDPSIFLSRFSEGRDDLQSNTIPLQDSAAYRETSFTQGKKESEANEGLLVLYKIN